MFHLKHVDLRTVHIKSEGAMDREKYIKDQIARAQIESQRELDQLDIEYHSNRMSKEEAYEQARQIQSRYSAWEWRLLHE